MQLLCKRTAKTHKKLRCCVNDPLGWRSAVLSSNWWVITGKSLPNFSAVICIVSPRKTHRGKKLALLMWGMLEDLNTSIFHSIQVEILKIIRGERLCHFICLHTLFSLSKMKRSLSVFLFKHMHTHAVSWSINRECVFNAVSSLNAFVMTLRSTSLVQTHTHREWWTCICNNT